MILATDRGPSNPQPRSRLVHKHSREKEAIALLVDALSAWNARDVERMLSFLHEDHVLDSDTLPEPVVGLEAYRRYMEMYLRAFPDLRLDITQVIPNERFIVERWTAVGTHQGELMGIAPTGRVTRIHGCSVYDITSRKILRSWRYWDTGTLLRQLGVLARAERTGRAQPA